MSTGLLRGSQLSLSEILSHVTKELGIDAADILILNSNLQTLEYGAERGFRTKAFRKAQVNLGESYAGRVALERRLVQIPNLRDALTHLLPAAGAGYSLLSSRKRDGTGYPRGLKGDQIPLTARIFVVVDVWDALTSDRPYRAAWTEEEAGKYIHRSSGTHFEPQWWRYSCRLLERDP